MMTLRVMSASLGFAESGAVLRQRHGTRLVSPSIQFRTAQIALWIGLRMAARQPILSFNQRVMASWRILDTHGGGQYGPRGFGAAKARNLLDFASLGPC